MPAQPRQFALSMPFCTQIKWPEHSQAETSCQLDHGTASVGCAEVPAVYVEALSQHVDTEAPNAPAACGTLSADGSNSGARQPSSVLHQLITCQGASRVQVADLPMQHEPACREPLPGCRGSRAGCCRTTSLRRFAFSCISSEGPQTACRPSDPSRWGVAARSRCVMCAVSCSLTAWHVLWCPLPRLLSSSRTNLGHPTCLEANAVPSPLWCFVNGRRDGLTAGARQPTQRLRGWRPDDGSD